MMDRSSKSDLAALELEGDARRQPTAGRLSRPGRLLGRLPPGVLSGVGAGLAVVVLVLIVASAAGARATAEAREAQADAAPASIVEEADLVPLRPTPRPIATRPPPAASPLASPPPIWEQREAGWVAAGVPPLQPPHLFPAERLRLLEGGQRARTVDVGFRVLLKSGSTAPLWGVLLSYSSALDHIRLQFFSDDYDGGRPYVALYVAKDGKDATVGPPRRVLDYQFWGRDSHRLTVQIGDQQVRAVLDDRELGRWPNPGITAASKGLYLLGGSRMLFESVSTR
jgi:hypothetical protein